MSMKSCICLALLSVSLLACGKADRSAAADVRGQASAGNPFVAGSVPAEPAASACAGADLQSDDARKAEYAPFVAGAVDGKVGPEDVEIHSFMRMGAWSVVFASIPIADPGWFVFETVDGDTRFKDVWAGMADEDDRPGLVDWAKALGAPEQFASCFAQTIVPPAAGSAPSSPYAFDIDVVLSDAARKRLEDSEETVIVAAMYFAGGKTGVPADVLNGVGLVDIGRAQIELTGEGRAAFDGSAVLRERLEFVEGDLQVNVNVFSGRRSSPDNLLDCGFFQDAVAVAAAQPVRIACELIAE